jgi:peptide deformylase
MKKITKKNDKKQQKKESCLSLFGLSNNSMLT